LRKPSSLKFTLLVDKTGKIRYHYMAMIILHYVVAALTVCVLTAFGAHEPTAPIEDLASLASAGSAAHATTNGVASLSTNDVVVSPHQKLIDAWQDVENVGDATPLHTVSLPISHYPNGEVRIQFKAKEALFPKDENAYLRAKNVYMEMFSPMAQGGRVEGIFMSDNCIYDRVLHDGYCEGWVRLQYRNVKIVGTNMTWNLDTRKAKITGGSQVTIENGLLKGLGGIFN
jgi:hypothetical protein